MAYDLRPLVSEWSAKLKLSWDHKKRDFQDDADEAMMFFNGPYDFLYTTGGGTSKAFTVAGGDGMDISPPTFRMTVNKVAELVQIFGPSLYHRNPVRKVGPRKPLVLPIQLFGDPNNPQVQQYYQMMAQQVQQESGQDSARAAILEQYLNYTPNALDLKTESRWAIDEAIIKGMGCLWTEKYIPTGAPMTMVGSFFDTVDNLLVDPDAECLRDAKWIARRRIHPHWEVERMYGLSPGTLLGAASLESFSRQSEVTTHPDGDFRRKEGLTNDLVVYWEIFSKMGMGGRMRSILPSLTQPLEAYGDFVYLVITENLPYPLNLPPPISDLMVGEDLMAAQAVIPKVKQMTQWPTPYWADDTWPMTPIIFHQIPRKVWPMSHIKPGMGELKFLNWAYSFLAGKVKTSCRDFLAIAKSAGQEIKDAILHGPDYTMIEIDALHESIDKVVKFLQHPEFNPEIYKVIEAVTVNFERRTGLTELAYGLTDTQIRSAQEANVKGNAVNVRPDDMANKVEDAMSEISRKEALAARWHLKGQDVLPILGPTGGQMWDVLVTASNPAEVIHELEYRIEANSAKKPNKAQDLASIQQVMQTLFKPFWEYAAQTGNVTPINNVIAAWAKSMDMEPGPFMLPLPPPPPQAGQGPHPNGPPNHSQPNQGRPPHAA